MSKSINKCVKSVLHRPGSSLYINKIFNIRDFNSNHEFPSKTNELRNRATRVKNVNTDLGRFNNMGGTAVFLRILCSFLNAHWTSACSSDNDCFNDIERCCKVRHFEGES